MIAPVAPLPDNRERRLLKLLQQTDQPHGMVVPLQINRGQRQKLPMHPVSVSFNETLAAVSQRGLGAGESIGEYWKPVFTLLEGTLQVLLVNAAHMMADLAKGRRSTLPQLKQDLTGLVGDHQRSLATQLVHIDFLEE
jgi:hypothetical protein